MLQILNIKNLALMQELSLELASGFTTVTGETGAGKSILLGALSILAGARVDKTVIRKGADTCEVEGALYFEDSTSVDRLLTSLSFPPCEDGILLLRRTLSQSSKGSRIQVNGALSTLAHLRRLSEYWIDFHGPGEPQKLFQEKYQLEVLDRYARAGEMLSDYQTLYQKWHCILNEMDTLVTTTRLSEDELEFFRNQVAKIDQLDPSKESIETLEREFTRFEHARELAELTTELSGNLSRGDNAASNHLSEMVRPARDLAEIDPKAADLAARLEGLIIELEDLASDYESLGSNVDIDPEAAETLQARMDLWLELKRKYGDNLETVLEKREALVRKIEQQSDIEGTLKKLEIQASTIEKELRERADQLRLKRQRAAKSLAKKCNELITTLGFKKGKIEIEITAHDTLKEQGNCSCVFLFAPNQGQDFLPLNKIASSGEIARVMLALKAVLAQVDQTPVLVFDEVDANVGGEIGRVVGKELANLSKQHQVFCITHLPQVAAQASHHLCVTKTQTDDKTTIAIDSLHQNREERIAELARMLGDRKSKTALTHAEELLS